MEQATLSHSKSVGGSPTPHSDDFLVFDLKAFFTAGILQCVLVLLMLEGKEFTKLHNTSSGD